MATITARKHLAFAALVLAFLPVLSPGRAIADDVLGTWLHESGQAQIRFAPCGEAICGHLIWIRGGAETNAKVGDQTFFDMKRVRPDLWRGKTLYPDDGKVYEASMQLDGAVLRTFGCAVGGMICKSVQWTRVR